jgi:predicted transcriptional regulator
MTITNEQRLVYEVLQIKFLPVLSQILGVSKKTIYRWINGDNKPSLDHYLQLQRILNDDLLRRLNDEKNKIQQRK